MAGRNYNSYAKGNTAKTIEFRQHTDRTQSDYVNGTAAPKRVPKEKPLTKRKQKQQQELEKQIKRAQYRHMNSESMSFRYVLFLISMVAVLVLLSVQYLKYEASISEKKDSINSLKSNIEVMNSQNDAIAYDIEAYIDLERIINVAKGELGMVMADSSQIKYFEKHPDEFMNQYADVPEQ